MPCRLVAPRPPLTVPDSFAALPAHLGLSDAERALPCARFFRPDIAPLPPAAAAALARGAVPAADFTPPERYAEELLRPGTLPVETGWTLFADGVLGVAVRTPMPGVRARMWEWWFGWHSACSVRYKLWHPGAHRVAHWAAPGAGHVGRTSLVRETIGRELALAIRFLDPAEIGVPATSFDGATIVGRGSLVDGALEEGGFMHQVRNTVEGCEMRSRFYFNLDPACMDTPGMPPAPIAAPLRGPAMLRHCAEEMAHLAGFLAELHGAFAGE